MIRDILVVAPHPDDETLGCGGVLLRHRADGDRIHWVIVSGMSPDAYPEPRIAERSAEIDAVAAAFSFASVHKLAFRAARLDTVPRADLVRAIGDVLESIKPAVVYLPYAGDAHSDHAAVFQAAAACTKWFRFESITDVLVYETLSETDAGIDPDRSGFRPQLFVDIASHIEEKVRIMSIYRSEVRELPFPRSAQAIRALATVRGCAMGSIAAESFMVLRQRRTALG